LKVLPILQKQPGFVDLIALRASDDQQRVVCLSFWEQRKARSVTTAGHYDSVVQTLKSVLETKPMQETLRVEISTAHHIAASRAA